MQITTPLGRLTLVQYGFSISTGLRMTRVSPGEFLLSYRTRELYITSAASLIQEEHNVKARLDATHEGGNPP